MNLGSFTSTMGQRGWHEHYAVIALKGPEFPLILYSFLVKQLKEQTLLNATTIDLSSCDDTQLKAALSVAFLGQRIFYFLGDLSSLDTKRHKSLLAFFKDYQGPHHIFFYSNLIEQVQSRTHLVVEFGEKITRDELIEIATLCGNSIDSQHFKEILKLHDHYSLEKGCLLIQYATIMSRSMVHDFQEKWMKIIFVPESSLFTLSGYFFARNQKMFFAQWFELQDTYPVAFWVTFWSEQLFRAASFIELMRANEHIQAKKISFRLPFTFLKTGWQQHQLVELQSAHDFLYRVDCSAKQGGEPFSLELFYLKYFLNEFK